MVKLHKCFYAKKALSKKEVITFRATPQSIMELDRVSKIMGESRSTVLRTIILNFLNHIYNGSKN